MGNLFTTFTNCRICKNGELIEGERLVASQDNGLILESTGYIGGEIIDLDEGIIAPGFLELHTNGFDGFHFTNFDSKEQYTRNLKKVSEEYVKKGITSFWATIPTVEKEVYEQILPCLKPAEFENGASLLGTHLEGPYLQPSKKGAHDASLFRTSDSLEEVYGEAIKDSSIVKLVTLAPEIPDSQDRIHKFVQRGTRVSLGHSAATYEQGLDALQSGATGLTHVMNCMTGLHHRQPSLIGLTSLLLNSSPPAPYFSILADGIHVHPRVAAMLYRANPERAILVSDSTELAGLPDGIYPGNRQIKGQQVKLDGKVVIKGSETLVGSCVTVDQCVKNLVEWTRCGIAEAVRTTTENVADFMGLKDRGKLEEGRRADFVVLDDDGNVRETWIAGIKVWEA